MASGILGVQCVCVSLAAVSDNGDGLAIQQELSAAELESKLKDLKAELFNLRFQLAINQLDNPMRISAVKKDIARVKTVLRQMELNDSAKA